jgi:hypothetical protein
MDKIIIVIIFSILFAACAPTAKDFRDMELLRQRFGVELPAQLKPGAA